MFLIALIVMALATLAQHLGLTEAISDVIRKIAKCPKCCSFWSCLVVLCMMRCPVAFAVGLSLLVSYLSYWFGIVLIVLQKLYNKIWEKLR